MIGLSTALITPKIRATAMSVNSFDVVDPAVSSMPGSTAVATARAAAETATRSRKCMRQSWHSGADHAIGGPWRRTGGGGGCGSVLSPPEMDEEPPEVPGVLLDAVVERLDLLLLQEPEHPLLELPRALARDDLNERGLLRHGLVDDRLQGPVDVLPAVVDVVQVELQLHGAVSAPGLPPRYAARRARGDLCVTRRAGGLRTALEPQPPDDLPRDVGGRVIVIDHDDPFGRMGRFDGRQLAVKHRRAEEMAVPALQPGDQGLALNHLQEDHPQLRAPIEELVAVGA